LEPKLTAIAREREVLTAVRERALHWLAVSGERDDDKQVDQTVRAIATDDGDARSIRERAIRELRHTPENDAWLRSLYAKLGDQSLKERVIRTLGESAGAAIAQRIERLALDEREPMALRERAIRMIGEEIGRPGELRQLYDKVTAPALRERILKLAGESGDAASMQWLHSIAENASEPESVRDRAIRILGDAGETTYLRSLYSRLSEVSLRDRVLRAVADGESAGATKWLRTIVADEKEDSRLRDRAVRSLADAGAASAELAAIYDAVGDRAVRERLIALLADRGDQAAVDKLGSIAKSDADVDLRRRAQKKLGDR
ncbi:MAG: hypothetical protein ABJD07_12500, partial [Gemmatimonadaceae bacterium]